MAQVADTYHRLRRLRVRKEDARPVLPNSAATGIDSGDFCLAAPVGA